MPIVFYGVKQFTFDSNKPSEGVMQCSQCGHIGEFKPATRWTFIHIFWIPLIPVWITRAIRCPRCGSVFKRK